MVSRGNKPTLKILGVVFRVEELPNGQVGPDEVVLQHDVDPSLQRRLSTRDEVAIWKQVTFLLLNPKQRSFSFL